MEDGSCSTPLPLVDDAAAAAAKFRKSLKELKGLSSQLYHIADYCETAFCTSASSPSRNIKPPIVESTKAYVSQAVVTMVDHLGSISATLELALASTNSRLPQTQRRIHILQHRIRACQQYPQKLGLARFQSNSPAHFSTFHCRYIIWKQDSTTMPSASASRASHVMRCIDDTKSAQGINRIPAKEPLLNYCIKYEVVHDSSIMAEQNNRASPSLTVGSFRDYKNALPPVNDGPWTLPKPPKEHDSKLQLQLQEQENRRPKGSSSAIKSKALQKKGAGDIAAALIRRGKRILA